MSKLRKSSSSGYGAWGNYRIAFRGDLVGCVPISDDGEEDLKHVVAVSRKDAPANIFEGRHSVQIADDKKSIKAFKPYSGQHPAKFVKFASKEDEPPVPKMVHGEFGDYAVFFPVFEIIGGQYKGCNASYQLAYKFQEGADGLLEFSGSKGKFLESLEEFLDNVLGQFDPPKFSDNMLPWMAKKAKSADKIVGLVFKKGWITTLVELEDSSNPPWKKTPDAE